MSTDNATYLSVIEKLEVTGYGRAEDLFENWHDYVVENFCEDNGAKISDFYDKYGRPKVDIYLEQLTCDLGMTKEHCYPEEVVPSASDEELDFYNNMSWEVVADTIEKGIKRFISEHYVKD